MCICILVYLASIVANVIFSPLTPFTSHPQTVESLPPVTQAAVGLGIIVMGLWFTVSVFHLAVIVYGTPHGVLMGILWLVPLLGIFSILAINTRATAILKRHHIRVGVLGVHPNSI